MTVISALILGLVQGLTEFFPVSSSAHLKLAEMLLGIHDVPLSFSLACHLATALVMVWFFKIELLRVFKSDRKKLALVFLALLPLVPAYFLFSHFAQSAKNPLFLGLFIMSTGGILLIGEKVRVNKKTRSPFREALIIGIMQTCAFFPGISRSGSTISCARLLGWEPKEAVHFSFLLAIPTILGGNLMEIVKIWNKGEINELFNVECLVAFTAALSCGALVINLAIRWLEKGNLKLLAWYCLGLGLLFNLFILGMR